MRAGEHRSRDRVVHDRERRGPVTRLHGDPAAAERQALHQPGALAHLLRGDVGAGDRDLRRAGQVADLHEEVPTGHVLRAGRRGDELQGPALRRRRGRDARDERAADDRRHGLERQESSHGGRRSWSGGTRPPWPALVATRRRAPLVSGGGTGSGERRMRIDGRRTLAALVLVGAALVLAGCHGGSSGAGNGRPDGIDVVSPAGRSQAPASGEVPVDVRLDRKLSVKSLRVWLVRGPSWSHDRIEITDRLVRDDSGATASLHAADLKPGLTTVEASARPRPWWGHDRDHHRDRDRSRHDDHGGWTRANSSTFSWEPAVDLATADRCDVLAPTKCLMPFPSDFFTVARRVGRDRTARALRPRGHAVELRRQARSTRPSGTATTASAPAR